MNYTHAIKSIGQVVTSKKFKRTWYVLLALFVFGLLSFINHGDIPKLTNSKDLHLVATAASTVKINKPASTINLTTRSSTGTSSRSVAITADTVPVCVPTSLSSPGLIDLQNSPAGLSYIVDPIVRYRVYGNTASEIRHQIQQCAPRDSQSSIAAEYTGQTSYQASWQVDYSNDGTGNCKVVNAKIGMHVMVTEPIWQATSIPSDINTQWQTFITDLNIHEQGHVQLAHEYASQMLNDLQNFPGSSCNGIHTSVNAVMQNDISSLNIANDQYDSSTNHGASQGAILPN
jgi:predicted secreted Zn-dependent protease